MPARILIVDDEPSIVTSLEFLMERQGYAVRVARDGQEALAIAATFAPDLILLDVMLPLRSGFDVCRALRAGPLGPTVKIILLTARGRASEIAQGLALGADAYITKPFSTTDLLAQVRALLGDEDDLNRKNAKDAKDAE